MLNRFRLPGRILPALLSCILMLVAQLPAHSQSPAPLTYSVLVELSSPSAAEIHVRETRTRLKADGRVAAADAQAIAAATQAQIATIAAEQATVQAALAQMGAQPVYAAQRIYNGIAVRVAADRIESLRHLPGVRAVTPLIAKSPDNVYSIPFLGIPGLWAGAAGLPVRGEGMRIAVIDTGIDYNHVTFGGAGSAAPSNDPSSGSDNPGFPNAKVIGGFDFVGDTYNADPFHPNYQPIPMPDPDPMDCFGHGTHVAGTAAGYGVTTQGKRYDGPWNGSIDPATLRIGPGAAPLAQIYALKVFGCSGSSEIVDQAVEWAVDPNGDGDFSDHVDVMNLSLGSNFGSTEDTTSRAVDAASAVGVIVVASAGNSGDITSAVGSPGVAIGAISVAATLAKTDQPSVSGFAVDLLAGFSSRGPGREGHLKPDLAAPGVDIASARNGSGSGSLTLSGTSMAAPHVAGAMTLLRQLRPTWSAEALKALVINTAAPLVRLGLPYTSTLAPPALTGSGRIDLSSAARSPAIAFDSANPYGVSLSFGIVEVAGSAAIPRSITVANQGDAPLTYRPIYQPLGDIPGVDLLLPGPPTMTVAAHTAKTFPVVLAADAAALQNRRDPTASTDSDPLRAWQNEESGLLWLWPVPARFDAMTLTGAPLATGTLELPERRFTYTISGAGIDPATVTKIILDRGLPGYTATQPAYILYERGSGPAPVFPLTGTVTVAARDLPLLASGALQIALQPDSTQSSALRGALIASTPPLKIPVHAIPRAASTMRSALPILEVGATGSARVPLLLAGTPLTTTLPPTGTQSLVSVLELHARSPRASLSLSPPIPGEIDLRYVGISSDMQATGSLEEARVFFGVAVYEPWTTPGAVSFTFFIDSSGDDVPDYRVFTTNRSALSGGFLADDRFMTDVEELATGQIVPADPLNVLPPGKAFTSLFHSRVLLISVPARLLGVEEGRTRLRIRVQSGRTAGSGNGSGDSTGVLIYDLARPGLNLANGQTGSPLFPDMPETELEVGFSLYNYSRSTARGVLLLHHHNGSEQQAEALEVRFAWPHVQLLPLIENKAR